NIILEINLLTLTKRYDTPPVGDQALTERPPDDSAVAPGGLREEQGQDHREDEVRRVTHADVGAEVVRRVGERGGGRVEVPPDEAVPQAMDENHAQNRREPVLDVDHRE